MTKAIKQLELMVKNGGFTILKLELTPVGVIAILEESNGKTSAMLMAEYTPAGMYLHKFAEKQEGNIDLSK